MVPLSGASSALIRRSSVVLPAPLGPTRPTRVFAWSEALAWATTTCGPKVFEMASICIIAVALYGVDSVLCNLPPPAEAVAPAPSAGALAAPGRELQGTLLGGSGMHRLTV